MAIDILPLTRDPASKYVPWFIAFMVWLATVIVAGVLILSSFADRWRADLKGNLTVQVPETKTGKFFQSETDLKSVLALIKSFPGIESTKEISSSEIKDLLTPWLGHNITSETMLLPLPRLISVKAKPNTKINLENLRAELKKVIPDIQVDDHQIWLDKLVSLTAILEGIALIILLLVITVSVTTIIFATRTSLKIHGNLVDLLHLMGAQDRYIAARFKRYGIYIGLKGSLIGTCMGLATLFILSFISYKIDQQLSLPLTLSLLQWALIISTGLFAIAITTITAWITVIRILGRIM